MKHYGVVLDQTIDCVYKTGLPELERLPNAVMNLAAAYQMSFGMHIPPLNYPLLLFRFVTELCLPRKSFRAR